MQALFQLSYGPVIRKQVKKKEVFSGVNPFPIAIWPSFENGITRKFFTIRNGTPTELRNLVTKSSLITYKILKLGHNAFSLIIPESVGVIPKELGVSGIGLDRSVFPPGEHGDELFHRGGENPALPMNDRQGSFERLVTGEG